MTDFIDLRPMSPEFSLVSGVPLPGLDASGVPNGEGGSDPDVRSTFAGAYVHALSTFALSNFYGNPFLGARLRRSPVA